jgi:FSR family fosmidomycin resistance protein-like MFS transporter
MDSEPQRHEHLMARWTLAGSLGVVAGPLLLGAALALGGSWRGPFFVLALAALALTLLAARHPLPDAALTDAGSGGLKLGLRQALGALRRPEVLHWLILLFFSDFMLDVLLGYLALYIVDVAGRTPEQGALAVAVWSGVGLLGDALLIPLLERVRGLTYLRLSVAVMLILFPAFLLVPIFEVKLVLLGLMGLFNAGWYAILKGQLYTSLPGQSGTVIALASVFSLADSLVPAVLGWAAGVYGLSAAMWLLMLGPIALLVGLRRK